jgi:hypothetical protein
MVLLEGPSEFTTKNSKILRDSKYQSIIKATLYFNNEIIELNENHFSLGISGISGRNRDTLQIYHIYKYLESDNSKMCGRWYDIVPLDTFRVLSGTKYTHSISYYEDDRVEHGGGPAMFVIEFTDEAVDCLRNAF